MRKSLAAAVLLLAGRATVPGQVSISVPEFGTVRAGVTAKLEWRGLPVETDELEILLSVEGRDLPIRLTPQLAPRARTLLWRVPNLPSRRARLTVRFGIDGEEVESAPSEAFEILPSGETPMTAIVFRDGEWWAEDGSGSPLRGLLGSGRAGARIEEEQECPPCSVSSTAPHSSDRLEPAAGRPALVRCHATASIRSFPPRTPIEVPARI